MNDQNISDRENDSLQPESRLNEASSNGWTQLMLAILYGRTDTIKRLLAAGADPNVVTSSSEHPSRCALGVAVANGRVDAVRELLKWGVDTSVAVYGDVIGLDRARQQARATLRRNEMPEFARMLESSGACRE